jgi:hypothetical protein
MSESHRIFSASADYHMSSLIEKLNIDATNKARNQISKKYQEPVDLDEISLHIAQLKKDIALAESQLSVAVQGKLEALKRAADIMDESSTKLEAFTTNLHKIDDRIAITNTVIADYPYLKRAHNARDNTLRVKSQVEFFAKVPDKVRELEELLDTDPSQLREVYLEAIKLDSLRRGLLDILERGYSDAKYSSIRNAVDNHLIVVPDLMKKIEGLLRLNLSRFYDLGLQSPADLVMTFEIIVMNQEYIDRRNRQLIRRAEAKQTATGKVVDKSKLKFKGGITLDAKKEMDIRLSEIVEKSFETAKFSAEYEKEPVKMILGAATVIISRIIEFYNEIVICIPPEFDSMTAFVEAFETALLPEIEALIGTESGFANLAVGNIMEIIDWVEYYIAQMEAYEYGDIKSVKILKKISDDLLNEYLYRIKAQVMGWFDNIKNFPVEITKTPDDNLTTSRPEDMFNVIHMQISVATEKLPREHLKDVINACLQVLREVQRQSYDDLSENWKSYDVELLCAFVNDYQRLQEKCDEFSDQVISLVVQNDHRDMLGSMLEEVAREYVVLAVTTLNFLARQTLADLEEPVFYKLFTAEWEAGEQLVSILVATIEDYFRDISNWLPQYFYSKFIHEVFIITVGSYLMSLRRHANGAFHFMSEMVAAARVLKDKEILQEFFERHDALVMKGPNASSSESESAVAKELIGLTSMATVISATHLSGAEREIRQLYEKYGGDGLRLVQALLLSSPTASKSEKASNIDKVTKLFEQGVTTKIFSSTVSDYYKSFDAAENGLAKTTNKPSKNRFWNRK